MKTGLTKKEEKILMELAEKCAGVAPGEKVGRWTHEDRVLIVYSVLCSIYRINKKIK